MKKRILALILALMLFIMPTACFLDDEEEEIPNDGDISEEDDTEDDDDTPEEDIGNPDQTWAIYWYLCGSDLETECAAATEDIREMMEVSLPENVKVIIETGGAAQWQNDFVDSGKLERYVYSSEGLERVDSLPRDNVGDPETLADFLRFCKENYPADKTAALFWNHGGGSVSGAAFDENYNYDSLTLDEFHWAFDSVFDLSNENPPFEAVGFDACLMATIDTAYAFSGVAKYLIASEELEPGCGWNYTGWLQALADNPGMDGAHFGKAVCDSYVSGCEEYYVDNEITLSVTDLTKIGPLLEAYDAMGKEALTYAVENPGFLCEMDRKAEKSENYGGNSKSEGYTNMVDLGSLAEKCGQLLPQGYKQVMNALENCIVYKINGPYREEAKGLSCYYSYNRDANDFAGYKNIGCSDAFRYLYEYAINGCLSNEGMEYVNNIGYESDTVPEIPQLDTDSGEVYAITLDDDGYATLELDEETLGKLSGVYFQMAYLNEENDFMLILGHDNDIEADWDNGIFKDNFRGVWGSIDGHLVHMELSGESDNYNLYSVPILLNGVECNLEVVYDFTKETFDILGARKCIDDNGMADKNLVKLKDGDEITTLYYAASISGDDAFECVEVETFTVTSETSFFEQKLGDGKFVMMFQLEDFTGNTINSQRVCFTIEGEDIYSEIID